jgi:hypothetical protein
MDQANQGGAGRDPRGGRQIDARPSDRRATPRCTVLDYRGWLGRWGERGFEVSDALLLDLGRGGALFETEEPLAEGETALLGLDQLREAGCLEVTVVHITRGRRKKHRVHAAFTTPCNEDFYATALNGP